MKKSISLLLSIFMLLWAASFSAFASNQFDDVPQDAWYKTAVDYAEENALMSGIGDGKFSPDGDMTRAQLVTILWRTEGEPTAEYSMPFDDVDEDAWYTEAVRWGASEQIVSGVSDTEFAPQKAVTREELAAMIYRTVKKNGNGFEGMWSFLLDYADADSVSDWAYEPMCWLIMNGIITGTGDNMLAPKESATRAQTAAIIMRMLSVEEPEDNPEIVRITVNTEGFGGQIDAKENGEELEFSDEYPIQSVIMSVQRGAELKIGAKPDEDTKFMKWTKDGADYSKEEIIEVTASENTEYIAVFGIKGSDETHVNLDNAKTLGEFLGLPNYASSAGGGEYIYVFEQDGFYYRVTANLPESILDSVLALEYDDEKYEEKLKGLISPLKIVEIENLSEMVPKQEELDKLVGKNCAELIGEDWYYYGINLQDNVLYMEHGPFSYMVYFDGEVASVDDFDEETDLANLTVKSVIYEGLGDAARK